MKNKFSIEDWLKASLQLMKMNWMEWLTISTFMAVILSGSFYIVFQKLGIIALELFKNQDNLEEILMQTAVKGGIFILGFSLFLIFIELFMIHTTSQWYSGKKLTLEETISRAFYSMPVSILLNFAYFIMASVAVMFCIFPVIFVIVYFLFILQALVIEEKGFNSFGRSIELVKDSLGNFMVLPFLISTVFQIIYMIPFYLLQGPIEKIVQPIILNKTDPKVFIESLLKSQDAFLLFGISILFFSLQTNLKSFLYTVAFEEARKEKDIQNIERKSALGL